MNKRKAIKAVEEQNYSSCEIPPWKRFKTKQDSYTAGLNSGIEQGIHSRRKDLEEREALLNNQERQARLNALRDVCQAGTICMEAMSKAYLAFEKVL